MIFRFTALGQMSRRITEAAGVYTVNDALGTRFPTQLVVPNSDEAVSDATSPRDFSPWRIRYRGGFQAPTGGNPQAGDRVTIAGVEYEATSDARKVDEGRTGLETYEVKCQPVADLYPLLGTLQEMDESQVQANVRFSVFRADETHLDTGTYEDFLAETHLQYAALVKINRQLKYGSEIYRLTSVELDTIGRFLRLTVRRSGG